MSKLYSVVRKNINRESKNGRYLARKSPSSHSHSFVFPLEAKRRSLHVAKMTLATAHKTCTALSHDTNAGISPFSAAYYHYCVVNAR